jgi:hypothetical protein
MKIGELAAQASLVLSAIRYYKKLGLLPPAECPGGQRCPSPFLRNPGQLNLAYKPSFRVTPLESAFSNSLDLKSFRIPAYVKKRGVGDKWAN